MVDEQPHNTAQTLVSLQRKLAGRGLRGA
jgi:hypothetical protein